VFNNIFSISGQYVSDLNLHMFFAELKKKTLPLPLEKST